MTSLTTKYDRLRSSNGHYSAVVYINEAQIIAENVNGTVIDRGTDAAKVINAALGVGLNVLLCNGTYIVSGADITIPQYGSLRGESNAGTIIRFDTAHQIKLSSTHSYAGNFQVTGVPLLAIGVTASHNIVENVIADSLDGSQDLTFMVWVSDATLEDIEFRNCAAHDCGRTGFYAEGDGATQIIKNLRYINCRAINCGKTGRNNEWVVGFDLAEGSVVLDSLFMQGCYATGSWESGFHLENSVLIKNSIIEGCISNNNGRDKTGPSYAAGFFLHNGVTLKNCTANENVFGVRVTDDGPDATQLLYIDIATRGNTNSGVLLQNTNNVNLRQSSIGDRYSLTTHNLNYCDLELKSYNATEYAYQYYTENEPNTDWIQNSCIRAKILNSEGDSTGITSIFKNAKHCDLDIYYRNSNSCVYNLTFSYLEGCNINLNASGSGINMAYFGTQAAGSESNIVTGMIRSNGTGVGMSFNSSAMAGFFILKNCILKNLSIGIKAVTCLPGTVIIDKKSIYFEAVTTPISDVSSLMKFISNYGYSSGTGSGQTIPHRLTAAPGTVSVVPQGTGATVSGIWADVTNIYLTLTRGKDFKWSAEV